MRPALLIALLLFTFKALLAAPGIDPRCSASTSNTPPTCKPQSPGGASAVKPLVVLPMFSPKRMLLRTDTLQGVVVMIDKRVLLAEQEYVFNIDETYQFEAQGLQPNSSIFIKVKKAGMAVKKEEYKVNKYGSVKQLFDTPNSRMQAEAEVTYTSADGKDYSFSFRVVFGK